MIYTGAQLESKKGNEISKYLKLIMSALTLVKNL